ncbi:hypothetical protein ACE38W_13280 [Chitinophaga sp. Hz27]|uniref:hypothetical protein n=1 Tax=Chitinophaga sp. Hz27 TaxID=3347169 RepID=UPI0035DB1733
MEDSTAKYKVLYNSSSNIATDLNLNSIQRFVAKTFALHHHAFQQADVDALTQCIDEALLKHGYGLIAYELPDWGTPDLVIISIVVYQVPGTEKIIRTFNRNKKTETEIKLNGTTTRKSAAGIDEMVTVAAQLIVKVEVEYHANGILDGGKSDTQAILFKTNGTFDVAAMHSK